MTNNPSSDDTATMTCPIDGIVFEPSGRRRYCSDRCRRAAWTRRHHQPTPVVIPPPPGPRRPITVYQCDTCSTRTLGTQRCDDCGTFMRRIGLGGLCPHCDEPVAATNSSTPTNPDDDPNTGHLRQPQLRPNRPPPQMPRTPSHLLLTRLPAHPRPPNLLLVEVQHPDISPDGRSPQRVWTVQLRRGEHTVIIANNLGWPTANALAHQLNDILHTDTPTNGAAID